MKKPTTKRKPTASDLAAAAREAARKADQLRRIDEFLAWTKDHPSVHDNPRGQKEWTPPHVPRDAVLPPMATVNVAPAPKSAVVVAAKHALGSIKLTSASVSNALRRRGE